MSNQKCPIIFTSVVSMLFHVQLIKLAGADGVAAYGVLQYVSEFFFRHCRGVLALILSIGILIGKRKTLFIHAAP